jgi:hypothetical protein
MPKTFERLPARPGRLVIFGAAALLLATACTSILGVTDITAGTVGFCTPDSTLQCPSGSIGETCTGGTIPDSTLNCGNGTAMADGSVGYCCTGGSPSTCAGAVASLCPYGTTLSCFSGQGTLVADPSVGGCDFTFQGTPVVLQPNCIWTDPSTMGTWMPLGAGSFEFSGGFTDASVPVTCQ